MYTIDLLKGKGCPPKSRVTKILFLCIGILLPILTGITVAGEFAHNKIKINNQLCKIEALDKKLAQLAPQMDYYDAFNKSVVTAKPYIEDITNALKRNVQWSGFIVEIINYLPGNIIISEIQVTSTEVKNRTQNNKTEKKLTKIRRTVILTICGNPGTGADEAVKKYIAQLRTSEYLLSMVDSIKLASKQDDMIGTMNVSCYEIIFDFKINN